MNIFELMNEINLDREVVAEVEKCSHILDFDSHLNLINDMIDPLKGSDAYAKIKELLTPDELGYKILTVELYAASLIFEKYLELGISRKIYIDTMKCFTRFTNEHFETFSRFGFDRDWWVVRQLRLDIFRLGELEYEMFQKDGEKLISIHIPSDANLNIEYLESSINQAKSFFRVNFPDYGDMPYFSRTWMLSSDLRGLLNNDSKILRFQELFNLEKEEYGDNSYLKWIYKRDYESLEDLPEKTSLQRNLKSYLLEGNSISRGYGILKK